MLIDVRLTYTGEKERAFAYSDLVNKEVLSLLPQKYIPHDGIVTISEGYVPEYDALVEVNNHITRFEVKTTNKENGQVLIEEARFDGSPAGLNITTADYYVFLHKTFNGNKQIGKLRIIPTDILRKIVAHSKQYSENIVLIQPDEQGPGSQSVNIAFNKTNTYEWIRNGLIQNNFDDGWLLDIDTTLQGYFDTSKILRKNKTLY